MKSCLLMVVILLIGSLTACEKPIEFTKEGRQLVTVVPVEKAELTHRMSFSGVLRPVDRARLAFQSSGVIETRPAELGQVVIKGELLATLDNPELGPAQRAAAAALQETLGRRDQARRDLDRLHSLVGTGAVGEEAVEQKQAQLITLEASVNRAEADLAGTQMRLLDASLVAPFDGVISAVEAEPGEFVGGGQTVMAIGGLRALEVEIMVPASLMDQLERGMELEIRVPQLSGTTWTGRVTRLSAVGNEHTGLFPLVAELELKAEKTPLRAGMLANVVIKHVDPEGLIVPMSAIVDPVGGDPRVYRFSNGQVLSVPVDIVSSNGPRVSVSPRENRELNPGDQVVTEGHRALTDGQSVRVL